MIRVFMRDQHRVDSVGVFADRFKPATHFLPADSRINEQPHPIGFDESCVAPAAAGQDGYHYGHRDQYPRGTGQNRGGNTRSTRGTRIVKPAYVVLLVPLVFLPLFYTIARMT